MEYCSDELMALYDSMEVKKDGSQKLTIDGKSQNCTQYQVLIPETAWWICLRLWWNTAPIYLRQLSSRFGNPTGKILFVPLK